MASAVVVVVRLAISRWRRMAVIGGRVRRVSTHVVRRIGRRRVLVMVVLVRRRRVRTAMRRRRVARRRPWRDQLK